MRLGVLNVALSLAAAVLLSGCATEHSQGISKPLCTTLEAEIGEEIVAMKAKVYRRLGNFRDQANLKAVYAGSTPEGEILVLKRGRQARRRQTGAVDELTEAGAVIEAKLQDGQWFELRLRVYVHDTSKARLTYHLERSPGIFLPDVCEPYS